MTHPENPDPKSLPQGKVEYAGEVHCPQCGELVSKNAGDQMFYCDEGHAFEGAEFLLAQIERASFLLKASRIIWQEQFDLAHIMGTAFFKEGNMEAAANFARICNNAESIKDVLDALIERIGEREDREQN